MMSKEREALAMFFMQTDDLWKKTEGLREELYDIVDKKGIRSPEAIRVSQALDEMVNEHYRIKQ